MKRPKGRKNGVFLVLKKIEVLLDATLLAIKFPFKGTLFLLLDSSDR